MTQEQVNKGGESPVMIHRPLGPGLAGITSARRPSFIIPDGAEILPRLSVSKESESDSLDTVNHALDL